MAGEEAMLWSLGKDPCSLGGLLVSMSLSVYATLSHSLVIFSTGIQNILTYSTNIYCLLCVRQCSRHCECVSEQKKDKDPDTCGTSVLMEDTSKKYDIQVNYTARSKVVSTVEKAEKLQDI